MKTILAADCGSTTTKAILIVRDAKSFHLAGRGEAPTTVEKPFEDVTVGLMNAIYELEEITGRRLSRGGKLLVPGTDSEGADIFLSTSSAGGGLQMLVMGVIKSMTAESAQRAALGAGAIIMDTIAFDDGRTDFQRIERIRNLHPDIILLAGGTDGGTAEHLVDLAELLLAAEPKPRFKHSYQLPVIYAGNISAREQVSGILKNVMEVRTVDNIRPVLEKENLLPAREVIHRLFLEHVMAQAPGYTKLQSWAGTSVIPTPAAVGKIMQQVAQEQKINLLGVDIGGATTDIFSVFNGVFNRTVNANLGMSYSICNVMNESGLQSILRWIPFEISGDQLIEILLNKMIRPTTIPETPEELYIEQAVAREALRLSLYHHIQFAAGLKGIRQERTIGDSFVQAMTGQTLVNLSKVDLIIGSGGVLSHAPERAQAALIMLDAFQPKGIFQLAVDSIFMMPQLGVLSDVNPDAAKEVFHRDCLIPLGTVIVPDGISEPRQKIAEYILRSQDNEESGEIHPGEIKVVPLRTEQIAELEIRPARNIDAGSGRGKIARAKISGGEVGLIFDCRGRPITFPEETEGRINMIKHWFNVVYSGEK